MKKKVLVSAYACEPGRGSEPGVGWNLVRELSSSYNLTVVTRLNNRETITACKEEWVSGINWIFIDPPKKLTFWKRGGRGVQLFYILWQFSLRRKVREMMKREDFDLFHHLTFGKYWVPSGLANLGVPMIFGPVGGGETTPLSLARSLSGWAKFSERARSWLKWVIQHSPGVKGLYSSVDLNIAATQQTALALQKISSSAVRVLPQSGIGQGDLANLKVPSGGPSEKVTPSDTLKLISACRLIYWKGVDLAIRAVGRALQQGAKVELTVLQEGPEKERLQSLVIELGLSESVKFTGRLPSLEDVYTKIQEADVLIHPAYHEAFGQSCLESLALGIPVLCLDWGGPGVIVDESTGIKVQPTTYSGTVESLAEAILEFPHSLREGGFSAELCKKRAFEEFSWRKLADSIELAYEDVCSLDDDFPSSRRS